LKPSILLVEVSHWVSAESEQKVMLPFTLPLAPPVPSMSAPPSIVVPPV
jgi:hypothetical protein